MVYYIQGLCFKWHILSGYSEVHKNSLLEQQCQYSFESKNHEPS